MTQDNGTADARTRGQKFVETAITLGKARTLREISDTIGYHYTYLSEQINKPEDKGGLPDTLAVRILEHYPWATFIVPEPFRQAMQYEFAGNALAPVPPAS